MEITAAQFRYVCERHPDGACRALLKSMRGFGYKDLTIEEVREAMGKALNGKEDEVISIWIKRYLENGVS